MQIKLKEHLMKGQTMSIYRVHTGGQRDSTKMLSCVFDKGHPSKVIQNAN